MKKPLTTILILSYILSFSQIIKEEINLTNNKISIPGTLSYSKIDKKQPLVIFIHGSGNIDRNGNQKGTPIQINYIKALADSLNNQSIAFYRYDKRTSIPQNLDQLKDITIDDFVQDAKVVIHYFKSDDRFSGIHLIGHSQGSLVAMLAAKNDVKSYISMAGAGETFDKIVVQQISAQNPELGNIAKDHFIELMEKDSIAAVNPMLQAIFAPQNRSFVKHWVAINPEKEIKKLNIPILILNGDADTQVTVSNAEKLKTACSKAKLEIIPKMNHLMKEVNSLTENQQAYIDAKYPISPKMLETLIEFIK
ncbi:alpha/beta hydrolase [Cellulophaga baltica]|uniref:alpha/beta hydrolase n=1 Tax=Cellulophaga TaxID=104264 RepID=UPI001C078CDD|nr:MULTISPECIES: alpha/beta hydrolase [Cellulophaga]MBU2998072.1 alpha/beta hydrolase [Cellulophaga baltica]MDO6769474.1 alpha/beta hydrolase [Cellulophaga sp. 1_MG-2023]